MYDAVADAYCYPGTTVLKNKLSIYRVLNYSFFITSGQFR
jgi:hypothetical protein